MAKEKQDITGVNCVKDNSGKLVVDGEGVKAVWQQYMEKLMNVENDWDHETTCDLKEGPADKMSVAEVRAALKCMKMHKAPGMSGVGSEMIRACGDTGINWLTDLLTDLCNLDGCLVPAHPGLPGYVP